MPRSVRRRLLHTLRALVASGEPRTAAWKAQPKEAVAEAMRPAPGQPTETERLVSLLSRRQAAGLGGGLDDSLDASGRRADTDLPALQNLDGTVSALALAELERRQREAAAAEDYERAGQLRDLLAAVRPQPPLSLWDAAPTTLQGRPHVGRAEMLRLCAYTDLVHNLYNCNITKTTLPNLLQPHLFSRRNRQKENAKRAKQTEQPRSGDLGRPLRLLRQRQICNGLF